MVTGTHGGDTEADAADHMQVGAADTGRTHLDLDRTGAYGPHRDLGAGPGKVMITVRLTGVGGGVVHVGPSGRPLLLGVRPIALLVAYSIAFAP